MHRTLVLGLAVLGGGLHPAARADHFAIDLKVQVGKASQSATADVAAVGRKPKPRPVFPFKAGESVTVRWELRSTAAKETVKDVVVHLVVVKEDQVGSAAPSKREQDVVVETALNMDFKPKDKAQGELSFVIPRAGNYLLRLETRGAAVGADGHEHFAAIDLVVK